MPTRTRLLAFLGGTAVLAGAVILLRATEEDPAPRPPDRDGFAPPVRVTRYAADNVVVPQPGQRPAAPGTVLTRPAPGRLRVIWADGIVRGTAVPGAVGYEVRWQRPGEPARTRLVIAPEAQLDRLADGQEYRVEVRSVDAFGQRSAPAVAAGVPGRADESWRAGLTGLFDDFANPSSVLSDVSGSHWHLSGYRGCVDLGPGSVDGRGLPIDLGCGADMAVLRARQPLVLPAEPAGGLLGRVALVTDTAAPGGELTVDLVPGPADRVGAGRAGLSAGGPDPTLPAGTIRAVVNDAGAQVRAGTGVPTVPVSNYPDPAPRRGPGVLHRFEVLLTSAGVEVRQDGTLIAFGPVLPAWRQASVLLGFRGPDGHRSRVHLAAAGFSGRAVPAPQVIEAPVNPGTRRVLGPADEAPNIGIASTPLSVAAAARLVVTITQGPGLDAGGVVVQLGEHRMPARLAVPGPPAAPGSAVTVIADVPPELLGYQGTLAPFVLRAPGAGNGVSVVESYLEITPRPPYTEVRGTDRASDTDPRRPVLDALPKVGLTLGNAAGAPLPTPVVPAVGQLVLTVNLDATIAQWDSGGVAGVQGFELWLDGRMVAGVPTAADGPGLGGRYVLSMAVAGLGHGPHVLEVREYGPNGAAPPTSLLRNFEIRAR
jgi:hypothetical protein